jgi:site-specific DNA-methyltransferase (adenine-specific)
VVDNALYYGDNLDILRRYIADESIDLVYLDPPFNSNRDYNVIFKDESGRKNDAQLLAFDQGPSHPPRAFPGGVKRRPYQPKPPHMPPRPIQPPAP